ncbi:MAG: major capsid protein [Selenomonadaceae bacterium]|nr:major capsid protein [Selenomonadaceae bacterium]MBR1805823.1 major capsid protein [Selenomonadaceae bacterium]
MAQNPWLLTESFDLLGVVERIKPPSSYLLDMFFPNSITSPMTNGFVAVEYRKENRLLAPFISKGVRNGVDVNRGGSKIRFYRAPLIAPRRTIGLGDIELRQFGEMPLAFSNVSVAERAARMQAEDLTDLLRMIQNTKAKMAADLLQTGTLTINGYADDGVTVEKDVIKFDWNGKVNASTDWSLPNADIYGDIKAISERIQEDSGFIPTLMVCGKNVEQKLLNNEAIFKWLSIPNRENLSMASFSPHYTSPQARFIGHISALNLEIVSYSETFTDTDGKTKPYIDPDTAIIGVQGVGRQIYGAITFMDKAGGWQTVIANNMPVYNYNTDAQQSSLSIFSRVILVPETFADWATINTKGVSSSTDPAPTTGDDDSETITDADIGGLFPNP